uniref:Ripply transcriptional repressor 2 n=1 Tax=Neolamprologus brichardi TaxID=32507 RepID=A0A3Q4HZ38_NEOBR
METCANKSGLSSVSNGGNSSQQSELWRPWFRNEDNNIRHKASLKKKELYWPKSRCFDYLYRDAEILLRNYPVQAAICTYEDSSSDEDNDDDEEEVEKERN